MDLADDPDRDAFLGGGEGSALAGEPGPYYEYVMGWHGRGCYIAELRSGSRDSSLCNPSQPLLAQVTNRLLGEVDGLFERLVVDIGGYVGGPVIVAGLLEVVAAAEDGGLVAGC